MENHHLTKKEEYLLKKQAEEQERLKKVRRHKIRKIVGISLPLILIAGGIIFAVMNYSPTEKLSFNETVGKQAPDFSLESIDGKTIKLSDYQGKNVVLFFNEGEMCYPACWDQIAALGNDVRFDTNDIVAFSIVVDQKSVWEKIVKKTPGFSNAKILFDTTKTVSRTYDVLSKNSSMHPGSHPGHTYFVIDKESIIRYTFDDPNMGIRNDELVAEIEKL